MVVVVSTGCWLLELGCGSSVVGGGAGTRFKKRRISMLVFVLNHAAGSAGRKRSETHFRLIASECESKIISHGYYKINLLQKNNILEYRFISHNTFMLLVVKKCTQEIF